MTPDEIRQAYAAERPLFADIGELAEVRLKEELRKRGIPSSVEARAKDIPSFVLKARRYSDPLVEITDKAGVRVVLDYWTDADQVGEIIRNCVGLEQVEFEDKADQLAPHELGYLGHHYLVSFKADYLDINQTGYTGRVFEIQVRSRAQDTWAVVSHGLLYKAAEAPAPVRRRINRLIALVELIDNEVGEARTAVMSTASYIPSKMLDELGRLQMRFTAVESDEDTSLEILEVLQRAYSPDELEGFPTLMGTFVQTHHQAIEGLLQRLADNEQAPELLLQPEALAIWERLEEKPLLLEEIWNQRLEPGLLSDLAVAIGRPL